ncbi:hypothetical protein Nepgr_001321 [Nepenthes gracilis]|uniref:holo-[acyl-carrier-protein] synthase n=1 Tax=Nepenthes gracilis TaxID=150966 RepID=A0AAD3P8C6_NEPGR|nr:hypothetical protein Nepgr_001321 [Nepenthes gracilis]
MMEKGVQRWLVDVSEWNPSPRNFSSAVSVLPHLEHSSITRYAKMEDRKRALVSRLLQYALVREVLGISFDEIIIKRTPEGKPYLDSNHVDSRFPNFNFNVSHHGDFVAIASEPLCLVGLDIVSHAPLVKGTGLEFIENFSSYFSQRELYEIINAGTCDEMLSRFHRYWSLKEAFVKAIGTGLGYRLDKLEFHHTNWDNISVKIDGVELRDWKFWHFELRKRHYVSGARGCPRMATESYRQVLSRTEFSEDEYHLALHLPNVSFQQRTVEQLIERHT